MVSSRQQKDSKPGLFSFQYSHTFSPSGKIEARAPVGERFQLDQYRRGPVWGYAGNRPSDWPGDRAESGPSTATRRKAKCKTLLDEPFKLFEG